VAVSKHRALRAMAVVLALTGSCAVAAVAYESIQGVPETRPSRGHDAVLIPPVVRHNNVVRVIITPIRSTTRG
jgi:hypothetical protein